MSSVLRQCSIYGNAAFEHLGLPSWQFPFAPTVNKPAAVFDFSKKQWGIVSAIQGPNFGLKPESGMRFWEGDCDSPPHLLEDLGERCNHPIGVWSEAPATWTFWTFYC